MKYYYLQAPSHSRLVSSLDEIKNCACAFVHIAIKRPFGYYHHLLVKNWKEAKKTIFEYTVAFFSSLFGQGEVVEEELSEEKLERSILAKTVYIIDAPDYPKTTEEICKALKRVIERIKEKLYALAYNNCEHLVNYVMTGKPMSEQINDAGVFKKIFIDSIDHCIVNLKMNLLKLLGSLITCIPVKYLIQVAVEAVIREATKSAVRVGAPVIFGTNTCTAKNICKIASKKMGLGSSRLLNSEACMTVAEEASKKALKCSAGTTFLVTGAVETLLTCWELSTLKKQKMAGHINPDDYDREWNKKISGIFGATAGSVGLGVLGQALCPVPLLGYALGNAAGNFCGRWFTHALVGYRFDKRKKETKE